VENSLDKEHVRAPQRSKKSLIYEIAMYNYLLYRHLTKALIWKRVAVDKKTIIN
jgi:hypothetical protein